jgi:phosphoribosylamine-glycine ligase
VGAAEVVVQVGWPLRVETDLVDTDEAAWEAAAEAPARELLAALQAAHSSLQATGGRVVVVMAPAGSVAEATGREAARLLAISARRRWAAEGITVEVVTEP